VTACTGNQPDDPDGGSTSAALRLETVSVAGAVNDRTRTAVETEVGDVLSGYVAAAFLGDYPRQDFVRSFDAFTPSAAGTAARDIKVLTGAGFTDASSVRATSLRADLSLFAPQGRRVGATAAVRFRFEVTADGATTTATFSGRLMLTDEDGAWSVFGYDVALDDGGAVEAAVS
jgi:hypothetical protein